MILQIQYQKDGEGNSSKEHINGNKQLSRIEECSPHGRCLYGKLIDCNHENLYVLSTDGTECILSREAMEDMLLF